VYKVVICDYANGLAIQGEGGNVRKAQDCVLTTTSNALGPVRWCIQTCTMFKLSHTFSLGQLAGVWAGVCAHVLSAQPQKPHPHPPPPPVHTLFLSLCLFLCGSPHKIPTCPARPQTLCMLLAFATFDWALYNGPTSTPWHGLGPPFNHQITQACPDYCCQQALAPIHPTVHLVTQSNPLALPFPSGV
jgi:hypothetical protein